MQPLCALFLLPIRVRISALCLLCDSHLCIGVYKILERVRDHFAPIGMHKLYTHHMAISNFTAAAYPITAPNTEESTELAGLAHSASASASAARPGSVTELVAVDTVDGVVAAHNIDHIIHAKIDTEGNDGRVLYGAEHTLRHQRIVTGVCEYDRKFWNEYGTPLRSVIEFLHKREYEAYFIAGSNLIRLSGMRSIFFTLFCLL